MKPPVFSAPCLLLLLLLLVGTPPLSAQQTNQNQLPPDAMASGGPVAAQAAADVWLALADDAQYAECWQRAAEMFQRAVPQEKWTVMANTRRTPLGKLTSRKPRSATFTTTLEGAPPGKYVVVVYDSVFEHKKSAVETVPVVLDPSGQWKVCGYFVH